MAIDSKNLLVWVKAMSRGQALPLDASEVYSTLAEAQNYASTSAIAYPGQTVKAKLGDGKYHSYTLQPSTAGYVLEEVGAIDESDLKQYVMVVESLPTSGQIEGVLYICNTTGSIWTGSAWKTVFEDISSDVSDVSDRVDDLEETMDTKAPIENPVFSGVVKVGGDEVALKSYVEQLFNQLKSAVPRVLNPETYATLEGTTVDIGTTFRVTESGTYWEHKCEPGDLIIVVTTTPASWDLEGNILENAPTAKWNVIVIQANIDGAVSSTADVSTVGEIVVFDAVTGKVIKGSGVQIASLNDAIAKAHEHSNKAILDTYNKTQTELLATAKSTAEGLVNTTSANLQVALTKKADKATSLDGYGILNAYTKIEIDGKLQTITDNLNTKITGTEVDTKISEAKVTILQEASEAANEALTARVGSIPDDTTIQQYIDTAIGSGGTSSAQAIAQAKQEAITVSKTYTDTTISSALSIIEI